MSCLPPTTRVQDSYVIMRILGLLATVYAAVTVYNQEFNGRLTNYQHLKVDNHNFADEVVLAWTTKGEFWVSHNQGQDWTQSKLGNVVRVIPHPHASERAFVFTNSKVYYTDDHAKSFNALKLPSKAAIGGLAFDFNKQDPNYLILHTKEENCNEQIEVCAKTAWHTRDGGRSWTKMIDHVSMCRFVVDLLEESGRDLVFCQQYKGEDARHSQLLSSSDYFKTSETKFEKIVGFALDGPFMVVASYNEDGSLLAYVTTDGHTFAPAHLPGDVEPNHKMGYTVIDTSTNILFLDITSAHEFGDIYKSNANGTDFTRILPGVNRNVQGFVDFEKISIEGVALANIVDNREDVSAGGHKVLKSRISHSDGAFWDPLSAPDGDCEGEDPVKCSLHLHSYTERYDPRNSPGSKAAVGMIIATGNVGESLLPLKDGNTYLSSDAGITWKEIAKEPKIWEYGDSGSIIVTTRYGDVTDTIEYSTDEGQTWQEHKFSKEMVQVLNIANIPSDTSRKFVIFARGPLNKGDKTLAITVQFDTPRQCRYDDFYEWSPAHPRLGKDECLFGHKLNYLRRKQSAECSVGKRPPVGNEPLGTPLSRVENCKCSAKDFECDYNHERAEDGTCKLIEGKSIPNEGAQCNNGGIYWRDITGYRKIAIDTCQGGEDLGPKAYHPCPGMEKEFDRLFKHRLPSPGGQSSGGFGFGLFLFIILLVVLGVGVAILVTTKGQGSSISLDDPEGTSGGKGVTAVLGTVIGLGSIVAAQFKGLADTLLGSVEQRFASRRGVYSRLDDDERARILSEHLSDDELDNPELENFNLYEDE